MFFFYLSLHLFFLLFTVDLPFFSCPLSIVFLFVFSSLVLYCYYIFLLIYFFIMLPFFNHHHHYYFHYHHYYSYHLFLSLSSFLLSLFSSLSCIIIVSYLSNSRSSSSFHVSSFRIILHLSSSLLFRVYH